MYLFSFHCVTTSASLANLQKKKSVKGNSIQGQLISQHEMSHILGVLMIYSLENWVLHLSLEGQAQQKQVAKVLKAQHTGV